MCFAHNYPGFAILIFIMVFLSSCSGWKASTQTKRPHGIILISLDTLRADHLGVYGYQRNTSPSIDAFAKRSIIFEQTVVQAPWTLPSHMSIMTSLYPLFHSVWMINSRLADEHVTLAELLKKGGYRTAAFVDSGWVRAIFGFDQGFDIYDDGGNDIRGIARILPKVKTWLDENKSEPFFLFLHVFDIHAPYDPPPPFNSMFHDSPYTGTFVPNVKNMDLAARKSLKLNAEDLRHTIALYDGDIRYADEKIGDFLSYLQSTGLWDQLCIIITSDHGEEFNEHGSYLHWQLYYRPDLHVPLIMHIPGYSQREIRISELTQSIDLLPTILEIAGLPSHLKAQGRSLIPLITKNASFFNRSIQHIARFFKKNENAAYAERETCFTEVQDLSIIRDGYQLIYNLKSGSTQLYNITIDKYAQNDIAKDHVDITKLLLTELKKAYSSTPPFKAPSIMLDEETQEHLKALGYIQ